MDTQFYESSNNYDRWKPFFIESQKELDTLSVSKIIQGEPSSLLDVGFGTGDILFEASVKLPQSQITAIEPGTSMFEMANGKYSFPQNVNLQQQSFEDFETEEQFAKIFMGLVLHNFEDKTLNLQKAYDLLETNGTLILTDMVKRKKMSDFVTERQNAVELAMQNGVAAHDALSVYKQEISDDTITRTKLKKLLSQAGFQKIESFWDTGSYYGVTATKLL